MIAELVQLALKHKQFVTSRINRLMDMANEERDYAAISFLKWFADEQIEEENTMSTILNN